MPAPLNQRGAAPTLVLTRADVRALVTMDACIEAVERAFARHAEGGTISPEVLGVHVDGGGFHVKTAGMRGVAGQRSMFSAKINANFPGNPSQHGLPTIQGVITLFDAGNGRLLALLDSMEITSLRTAAATAVAAKQLARADAQAVAVCGCGEQGRAQLRAIARVRQLTRVVAFDADSERAGKYADDMSRELGLEVTPVRQLDPATRSIDIWITCTPARRWIVGRSHVAKGAFVAAVGADNPDKQEIEPELLATSTVVVDSLQQCASIGDLHHAIAAGVMCREDVHAELADVVSGKKAGREHADQIIVFDCTGTALEDVAAATLAYEQALVAGAGLTLDLGA